MAENLFRISRFFPGHYIDLLWVPEGASSVAPSFPAGAGKDIFVDENTSLLGSGETEITLGFPLKILFLVFIILICFNEPLTVCGRNFVPPDIDVAPLPSGA